MSLIYKMQYLKATDKDIDSVFNIIQNTVKAIYPKYYPSEVVDFFCSFHNRENIAKNIKCGNVDILMVHNQIGHLYKKSRFLYPLMKYCVFM